MSSYHTSFKYKGYSSEEKGLIIAAFDADMGETSAFLDMESQYADNVLTGVRHDYGAKYSEVAQIRITLLNFNGTDFSVNKFRDVARWLSGAKTSSWLDLYENDALAYSFLCKCINVQQYKMDSRTIGIIATFESVSPWAYSEVQTITKEIDNVTMLENGDPIDILNMSDEGYAYVYPTITFVGASDSQFELFNTATGDKTVVKNVLKDEVITMNNNQIIYSSDSTRVFSDNDFNFVWQKLVHGTNELKALGQGTLTITYRYPIKIGDCVVNVDDVDFSSAMCQEASLDIATDIDVANMFNDVYNTVFGGVA